MSKFLSAVAMQEFDSMVKHAYQNAGYLRNTVTNRTGVTGDIYKFRRMGKGLANQKASQAEVTPMDVSHALINCILENWNAPEYTDIFDQAEVNFDEKSELATLIAMAQGRRQDQLIIDALETIPPEAGTALADIPVNASGMTVAKLRLASKALNNAGVPSKNRHIVLSADALESLLRETETTSSDFNTIKALVQGELDTFMGFKFHMIEERDEGGLPGFGTTSESAFAYHQDAVGLATGIDLKTSVDWVPERTSWLSNGIMKAGAVVRDAQGVVEILHNSTL